MKTAAREELLTLADRRGHLGEAVVELGSSGNIGAYALRLFESFPSFIDLLERQVTGASRPSAG